MKSILYVGATLMIGASIYGFVDYKRTTHNREFTKMYDAKEDTKEAKQPAITTSKTNDAVVKKEPVVKEKIAPETNTVNTAATKEINTEKKYKKRVSYKLFSRAPLERKYIDKELKPEEPLKTESKEQ